MKNTRNGRLTMVYGDIRMIVDYEGHRFVYEPDLNFLMVYKCYENGCNCYNCTERVFDGCIIDEIDEEILQNWRENEGF